MREMSAKHNFLIFKTTSDAEVGPYDFARP
jgi:hypothetical protein